MVAEWRKKTVRWPKTKSCEECEEEMQNTGNFAMDVYKDHLRNRQIVISGVIDETMVEKVTLQILKFNEIDDDRTPDRNYDRRNNPITIKIASPGGLVDTGLGIVSQIIQSETPVITCAIGDCASMAALILAASHVRFISMYSRVMIHSLSGGVGGKLHDIYDKAEELEKLQQVMDKILVDRTLIPQKKLTELHARREDWFLSAVEAKEWGVVDEVMEPGLIIKPIKKRKVSSKAKQS